MSCDVGFAFSETFKPATRYRAFSRHHLCLSHHQTLKPTSSMIQFPKGRGQEQVQVELGFHYSNMSHSSMCGVPLSFFIHTAILISQSVVTLALDLFDRPLSDLGPIRAQRCAFALVERLHHRAPSVWIRASIQLLEEPVDRVTGLVV